MKGVHLEELKKCYWEQGFAKERLIYSDDYIMLLAIATFNGTPNLELNKTSHND